MYSAADGVIQFKKLRKTSSQQLMAKLKWSDDDDTRRQEKEDFRRSFLFMTLSEGRLLIVTFIPFRI
jgi:hypothetical protein